MNEIKKNRWWYILYTLNYNKNNEEGNLVQSKEKKKMKKIWMML